ncbi:hypothetical protein BHM03_00015091 [Ensete ventricosum]|nr:hypothetical protein BHM03_00015091 [Ensete ventricosum]
MPLIPRRRRRRRRHVATKVMTRGVTRLRVAHPMVRGAEVRCGCRVTAMTSGRRSIPEVRKGRRRRLGCRLDRAEESSGSALYRSRLEYMGCVARAVSRVLLSLNIQCRIVSMAVDVEKSTVTIVGVVDAVRIVKALRKAKKPAEIESVGEPDKKADKKDDKKDDPCKLPPCCNACKPVIIWQEEPNACTIC